MSGVLTMSVHLMADASGAVTAMRDYVAPTIKTLAALASIASVFFLINGGYLYMTSAGRPDTLDHAKRVMRNALIGLVIVLSAATLTSILTNAYGHPANVTNATLPSLQAISPDHVSNGLVDVLIKAVTGLLNNIIQAIAAPILAALSFFTHATPLMVENQSVFNLWLAIVGMTDVLFIIVLALLGFHVMSATTFGFDEIDIKHLLPRIALVFLLINTSIFLIDGVIDLSNALINALHKVGGDLSVWQTLTDVVKNAGGQGVAALLVMLAFLIFSVMLLVYYVGRLVVLFIGAVLSPLVFMLWLVPGFRDFTETAIKTYITTIFVLFVHVIILLLAASLFSGMSAGSGNSTPDTLLSMVVGLATVMVLLRTQGVMMQFSYVSMGTRNARMLGSQFMNGVSYMAGRGKATVAKVSTTSSTRAATQSAKSGRSNVQNASYAANKTGGSKQTANRPKTGTTYEAPKITARSNAPANKPSQSNVKDKAA